MGTLADVVALDRADDTPVPDAMDAPTVAAEGRTYLPGCAAALGWVEGERLRLWVQAGHGVLCCGDGPGKAVRLGTQHRLTLPGPARAALRTRVGEKLLALVPPGEDWVLLLSAAGAAEAARALVLPAHVRRLHGGRAPLVRPSVHLVPCPWGTRAAGPRRPASRGRRDRRRLQA